MSELHVTDPPPTSNPVDDASAALAAEADRAVSASTGYQPPPAIDVAKLVQHAAERAAQLVRDELASDAEAKAADREEPAPASPVGVFGRYRIKDPLDPDSKERISGYGVVVEVVEENSVTEDDGGKTIIRKGGFVIVPLPDPLGLVVPASAFTPES